MKYIKCIKYDIVQGIFKDWKLFFPWIIMGSLFSIDFSRHVILAEKVLDYRNTICYADYLCYIFAGMLPYEPSPDNMFIFPPVWICIYLYLSYVTLKFPYENLFSHGQQVLIRIKSRKIWWTSKCIWIVIKSIIFYLILYLDVLVICVLQGNKIKGIPNNVYMSFVNHCDVREITNLDKLLFGMFVLPLLITIALNILQLTTSLWWQPIFSILLTSIILVSSCYMQHVYLIGNYGMILRNTGLDIGHIDPVKGIILLVLFSIGLYILGCYQFGKKDILKKR